MFKVEPIGNVDVEIINLLGLSSELETIKSLEVILFNPYCVQIDKKSPPQVLYECGIYNIFLPRSEIVYDEPEAKGSQHLKASSHQNVINVDLSAYQLKPGYYHLCHFGEHQAYYHNYGSHRSNHRGENIPLGSSAKIIFGEDDEQG
ncbi:hypothetical protein Vadar_004267 [Vaccinium darrowii]|uniref:Uncharacterized protein n=1 Tax=Vaccinium darrowii TaxID=229202 RepID=A0ACB7XXX4_9ERIC|nr:hypothetical protein Vadar_004267 [Vaccinium darrowii]